MPVARYCKNEKMGSVLEAIDDSNLPPQQKEFLLKPLDGTAMASSNFKLSKGQQGVSHLPNYLTESDWSKFRQHILLMDANGIAHSKNEADGLGVFEGNMQEAGIGIASALNQ